MTGKSDAYRKIAEGVEALEEIGLDIEETDIQEMQTGVPEPLADMFGMGGSGGSQQFLVFVTTFGEEPEADVPEYPDPPNPEDLTDIDLNDAEDVAEESDFESDGQETDTI